jgi:hypothetical protein
MAKEKFRVRFVAKGTDGAAFALELQKLLNKPSLNNWNIIRTDNMGDGYLVVAVKIPPQPVSLLDMLREKIGQGMVPVVLEGLSPETDTKVRLDPESATFLDTFFSTANSRDKKRVIEKMPEVLPQVFRRYPNEKLRPIIENIKAYKEDHMKGHAGPPCDLMEILQVLVESGEKHIQQNAC